MLFNWIEQALAQQENLIGSYEKLLCSLSLWSMLQVLTLPALQDVCVPTTAFMRLWHLEGRRLARIFRGPQVPLRYRHRRTFARLLHLTNLPNISSHCWISFLPGNWSWPVALIFVCSSWLKRRISGNVSGSSFIYIYIFINLGEIWRFVVPCFQVWRTCCCTLKLECQGRAATTLQKSWCGTCLTSLLLARCAPAWRRTTASRPTVCCWLNTCQTNTPGKKSQAG